MYRYEKEGQHIHVKQVVIITHPVIPIESNIINKRICRVISPHSTRLLHVAVVAPEHSASTYINININKYSIECLDITAYRLR